MPEASENPVLSICRKISGAGFPCAEVLILDVFQSGVCAGDFKTPATAHVQFCKFNRLRSSKLCSHIGSMVGLLGQRCVGCITDTAEKLLASNTYVSSWNLDAQCESRCLFSSDYSIKLEDIKHAKNS